MRRLNMALLVGLASRLVGGGCSMGTSGGSVGFKHAATERGNISGGWLVYEFHTNRVPVRLDESKLDF